MSPALARQPRGRLRGEHPCLIPSRLPRRQLQRILCQPRPPSGGASGGGGRANRRRHRPCAAPAPGKGRGRGVPSTVTHFPVAGDPRQERQRHGRPGPSGGPDPLRSAPSPRRWGRRCLETGPMASRGAGRREAEPSGVLEASAPPRGGWRGPLWLGLRVVAYSGPVARSPDALARPGGTGGSPCP